MSVRARLAKPKYYLRVVLTLSVIIAGLSTFYAWNQQRRFEIQAQTPQIIMDGYSTQPDDLSITMNDSAYVVEGTVLTVEPAQWTTSDKKRPSLETLQSDPTAQLRTPVRISIETVYKGKINQKDLLFTIPGGTDTSTIVEGDMTTDLRTGQRIIVFLSEAPRNASAWAKISPYYPQSIFLVDQDAIHGPLKTITRPEFEKHVGKGVKQ